MSINDRMLPILTGQVTSPVLALDFKTGTPTELFWRALHEDALDVTEMSLAAHAILTSRDENPFVGLPVFTSRMFRHGSIFVSESSQIHTPADLGGQRVGIPEYQMTAAVWMRGILQETYGVTPGDISWITGGVNAPGRKERVELRLADKTCIITPAGANETLNELLMAGEIDAIMAPQIPDAFRHGDPRVRRLFADYRKIEESYFAETQIFPIMHLLVLNRQYVQTEPDLPKQLFQLFEDARRHSMATLNDADASHFMLPWQINEAERTAALMGKDYWPYGIEANAHVLETFLRYLDEQGLLERPISVDDLLVSLD